MPQPRALAPDDETLAAAAVQGDADAFEEIVRRHRPALASVARRYVFTAEDVDDVTQDVFVKAYRQLAARKPGAPLRYWLLRIAINVCIDRARRAPRDVRAPEPDECAWLEALLAARSDEEHRRLERCREARSLLAKVLPRVSPKDRAALYLVAVEGWSVAEVGRLLGWSQMNVKIRAFRARRVLRKALADMLDLGEE